MKKQTVWVRNTCSSKPAVTDSLVVIFQKVQCINHSLQLTEWIMNSLLISSHMKEGL